MSGCLNFRSILEETQTALETQGFLVISSDRDLQPNDKMHVHLPGDDEDTHSGMVIVKGPATKEEFLAQAKRFTSGSTQSRILARQKKKYFKVAAE